jgi:hypothetical protein
MNSNQILKLNQETHKIGTPASFHELMSHLGANRSLLSKFHQILSFQEESNQISFKFKS